MCFTLYYRTYGTVGLKHEPLTLITPQFETPLPPLQPAVSKGRDSFPVLVYCQHSNMNVTW